MATAAGVIRAHVESPETCKGVAPWRSDCQIRDPFKQQKRLRYKEELPVVSLRFCTPTQAGECILWRWYHRCLEDRGQDEWLWFLPLLF